MASAANKAVKRVQEVKSYTHEEVQQMIQEALAGASRNTAPVPVFSFDDTVEVKADGKTFDVVSATTKVFTTSPRLIAGVGTPDGWTAGIAEKTQRGRIRKYAIWFRVEGCKNGVRPDGKNYIMIPPAFVESV